MARAYLSLGSNLGDRLAWLTKAEAYLRAHPDIHIRARSSVYETEPVGVADQPWFLNRVLEIDTVLAPHTLLEAVQQVEAALGRTRPVRWGPRTIDIDILLYGDEAVVSQHLTIPHPELARRRFALLLLAEVNPDARLPDGRSARDLLQALGDRPTVRRIEGP